MKQQFLLFRRNKSSRGSKAMFYLEDTVSGKKTSLRTTNRAVAERLLHAHREAHQQPIINIQIARAYVAASDPAMLTRTS